MQNSKLVKYHRHSEGVKRLWESPLLLLRKKREIDLRSSLLRLSKVCKQPLPSA